MDTTEFFLCFIALVLCHLVFVNVFSLVLLAFSSPAPVKYLHAFTVIMRLQNSLSLYAFFAALSLGLCSALPCAPFKLGRLCSWSVVFSNVLIMRTSGLCSSFPLAPFSRRAYSRFVVP